MSLNKRGNIWHYSIIDPTGERHRGSTGKTDKREAQKYHDDLRHQLGQRRPSGFTLADALRAWLTESIRSDKEKSAIRVLLRCYPSRPVSEVVPHKLVESLAPRKQSTINRTLNIVNAAIALSSKRGECAPLSMDRKPAESTRLRFLTKDEWADLYARLPPHLKPIALFAISTGLRRANVLGLKWRAVDLDNKLVWVDAVDAKGGRTISVPLSDIAHDALKSQVGIHKEYVFTYKREPIGDIKHSWNNALVRAGIDLFTDKDKEGNDVVKSSFTFHGLRHTWASWHVQKGTPLAVLKELGGWSDMDMVMRYAHLSPAHLREWV